MEDSAFPTPAISKSPKKPKRFLFLVVAIVIILIIIFAGNKLLGSKNNKESSEITPTPTEFQIPTDTPEPSPSEEPTLTSKPTSSPTPKPTSNPVDSSTGLDRSKLSVTVQNGSGQAGVAGTGSNFLKQLGYNVTSTGNADNFDYTNVSVSVKNSESEYLNLIKKDLEKGYSVASTSANLDNGFSSDALVIIGK